MIKLTNINKRYGYSLSGVHDITYTFNDTGMYFIEGTSGCGKTTLLNILGGIDTYDKGSYIFWEQELKDLTEEQLEYIRATYIGFVFQDFKLFTNLTVQENIEISCNSSNPEFLKNIDETLEKLGILQFKKQKVQNLSAGQKQRVAIARALIKKPRVLLCDEPTGNLDSESSKMVMAILKEISKERLVIVVSHDHDLVNEYANYSILMKDGKIIDTYTYGSFGEQEELTKANVKKSKISYRNFLKENFKILRHSLEENIAVCFIYLLICVLLSVAFSFLSFDQSKALHQSTLSTGEKYMVAEHQYSYSSDGKTIYYNVDNGCYHEELKDEVEFYPFYESKLIVNGCSDDEIEASPTVYVATYQEDFDLQLLSGSYPNDDNDILVSKTVYDLLSGSENYLNNFGYNINICGVYQDEYKSNTRSTNELVSKYRQYGAYVKNVNVLKNVTVTSCSLIDVIYNSLELDSVTSMSGTLTNGVNITADNEVIINKACLESMNLSFDNVEGNHKYNFHVNASSEKKAQIYSLYLDLTDGCEIVGVVDDGLSTSKAYLSATTYEQVSQSYFEYFTSSFMLTQTTKDNIKVLTNNDFKVFTYYSDSVYSFQIVKRIVLSVLLILGALLIWYGVSFLKRDIDQLFKERKEEIGILLSIGVSKRELYISLTLRYIIMIVGLFCLSLIVNIPLYLFINSMISNIMFGGVATTIIFVNYLLNVIAFIVLLAVVTLTAVKRLSRIKNNNVVYWMKNDQ